MESGDDVLAVCEQEQICGVFYAAAVLFLILLRQALAQDALDYCSTTEALLFNVRIEASVIYWVICYKCQPVEHLYFNGRIKTNCFNPNIPVLVI